MCRKCTGLFISLLFLLLSFALKAQNVSFDTLAFYRHLVKNNLQREQIAFNMEWLNQHKGNIVIADSSFLNNAILYYRLNLNDSSVNNIGKISRGNYFTPPSERLYLSMLILDLQLDEAENIIAGYKINHPANLFLNDARLSIQMLKRENIHKDTTQIAYSPSMEKIREEYESAPHHSPVLAGLYSAVIPGLGKWYLGDKHQAISAFAVNMLLAGQSIESYVRAGPGSARFIVSASLFGLFYGGNILGSILTAKKQRHDYFKQIDYEIFNFYNAIVGKPAY